MGDGVRLQTSGERIALVLRTSCMAGTDYTHIAWIKHEFYRDLEDAGISWVVKPSDEWLRTVWQNELDDSTNQPLRSVADTEPWAVIAARLMSRIDDLETVTQRPPTPINMLVDVSDGIHPAPNTED